MYLSDLRCSWYICNMTRGAHVGDTYIITCHYVLEFELHVQLYVVCVLCTICTYVLEIIWFFKAPLLSVYVSVYEWWCFIAPLMLLDSFMRSWTMKRDFRNGIVWKIQTVSFEKNIITFAIIIAEYYLKLIIRVVSIVHVYTM